MPGSCRTATWRSRRGPTARVRYLKDVDWSRTRAYTFGLAGVYINQKGREAEGIVEPGGSTRSEARTRREALRTARRAARPSGGPPRLAVRLVVHRPVSGRGARCDRGIRGRLSRVVGCRGRQSHCRTCSPTTRRRGAAIIASTRTWFPGVLFSNRKIEAADPGIEDMAPTALDLFGIEPPPYMEGKSVLKPQRRPLQHEVAA